MLCGDFAAAEQRLRELERVSRPSGVWFDATLVLLTP
jgi:hypothetical protein